MKTKIIIALIVLSFLSCQASEIIEPINSINTTKVQPTSNTSEGNIKPLKEINIDAGEARHFIKGPLYPSCQRSHYIQKRNKYNKLLDYELKDNGTTIIDAPIFVLPSKIEVIELAKARKLITHLQQASTLNISLKIKERDPEASVALLKTIDRCFNSAKNCKLPCYDTKPINFKSSFGYTFKDGETMIAQSITYYLKPSPNQTIEAISLKSITSIVNYYQNKKELAKPAVPAGHHLLESTMFASSAIVFYTILTHNPTNLFKIFGLNTHCSAGAIVTGFTALGLTSFLIGWGNATFLVLRKNIYNLRNLNHEK